MRRPLGLLAAFAASAPLLAAAPLAGQVVVDSFTTDQATVSDPPGGASNVVTAGTDILGQNRGLRVQRFAGSGPVTAGVSAGALDMSVADTTPDSTGAVFVIWDGDGDPNAIDPTGLGGVDLTAGGAGALRLTISTADAGTSLVLEVYEDADSVSRGAVVLPLIAAPVDIFVDFSSLTTAPGAATPADLTAIGAISLRIESGEAVPAVVIDRIETAAPQLAALKVDRTPAGDPIPGAVAPGDTIRYRITISNAGAGAAGVELADVLDPNLALVAGSVRTTPLARPDVYRTVTDQPIDSSAAALPALLDNDADPDGDALAAVPATGQATSQGGSVDVAADGHFVYTPPAGFNGVDDFLYTIASTAGDPTVDASGAPIGPATARARIVIDRAPPVVVAGGTLAYTENDPPTAVDPALTVTDADSANLASATVQISGNYQNGEDVLSFVDTATITGVFTPATGTLALAGLDTVANWQTALRSIAYENTSEDPDPADRTVTWIASDGVESSAAVTSTIEVVSVNDAPVITTSGGATSFVEDAGAVAVDGALTVADADDTDLVSATVTLTNPQNGAQEALSITAPAATCPGLVVSAPGHALSITGTATVAVYEGCLRSVLYANASQNPTALPDRLVTFVADDGDDPSNTASKTVTVTPVNDPPVVTGESFQTISNTRLRVAATDPGPDADGPYAFAAGNLLANDSDPDGPSPLTTSLGTATAGAVVVVNSNGTFSYTSPAGRTVDDSFTYNVSDGDVSVQGTVTISFLQRVWYVRNNATAGGLGRSLDPFDTLAEAQTASAANDWIFVYNGDGTTAGQNAGITLKAGQRLVGEGVGLSIPVALNGNPSPVNLVAAGTRPMLDNTTVGGSAAMATDVIPAQIVGLNLAGNTNAVDVTLTGAFAGSGTLEIANNTVRASGVEGIDVNAGGTGTLALAIHDNGITAGGTGLDVQRTNGTVQVTTFDDNVVSGNTGGSGIVLVGPLTFDGTPGGAYQQVAGGVTVIGASGNGVGANALVLTGVSGDLAFTDLDVFADNGAAIRVSGTGAVNVGAGTGTRVTVGAGVGIAEATGGPAIDLSNLTASLPLTTVRSTNTTTTGVSLATVLDAVNPAFDAQFTAGAGSTITTAAGATGPAFNVSGGNGRVNYAGTITNNSTSARAVSITTWAGDDASDDLLLSGAVDENGAGILLDGNGGSRAITFSGGLDVDTTTGEGFVASSNTNALGVNVTGTNTIDSVSATALRVTNTAIGASDMTFRSISSGNATAAADPVNGIVVSGSAASTGRLIVTGSGGACSSVATCTGGAIQNTSGDGIALTTTRNVSITRMFLADTGRHGVSGTAMTDVTGGASPTFEIRNSHLSSPGDADNESALYFDTLGATNITGRLVVADSTIANFEDVGIHVGNVSGTLTIDVTNVTINNNSDTNGEEGIDVAAEGTASITLNVSGTTTFTDLEGGAMNVIAQNSGVVDINVSGATVTGTGGPDNFPTPPAMTFSAEGASSTMTFDILNNFILDSSGDGIFVGHEGAIQGRINGNVISGMQTGDGLRIDTDTTGSNTVTIQVDGNSFGVEPGFTGIGDDGIQVLHRDGTKTLNLTISNNSIGNTASEGIRYFADDDVAGGGPGNQVRISNNAFSAIGDPNTIVMISQDPGTDLCAHVASNTGVVGITLQQSLSAVLQITQPSTAALAAANGGAAVTPVGTITFNGTCSNPPLPTNP